MATYKIDTGLWATEPLLNNCEFDNDKDAWETLRKQIPHKFGCLYKMIELPVKVNNEKHYVKCYNSKYGPKPIGYGPEDAPLMEVGKQETVSCWVPVMLGITDDPYNIESNTVQHE